MIDIACLGMRVVGPDNVTAAKARAEGLQPPALTVIKDPNAEIRIILAHRTDYGAFKQSFLFVVSADEDIDQGSLGLIVYPPGMQISLGAPIANAAEKHHR